jgi:predicted ATPase
MLISCKTSPPRLEHLESLLARKAKFGGRFATTLVCMEHEGSPQNATQGMRDHQRSDKLQQLRLLGMQGAFADQLDEIFQIESPSSFEPSVSAARPGVPAPVPSTISTPPAPDRTQPFRPQIAVLTGGPGFGKTTLLNALAGAGMIVIREAALELINELNEKLGAEEQRAWRSSHFMEFQDMLIERQLQLEGNAAETGWNIADRGLLDIVGFCRFKRTAVPVKLTPQLLEKRYRKAFLLEPIPDFTDRRSTGRIFNREEAIAISDCLGSAYSDAGVPVIRVPFVTVEERVAFVLKHLTSVPK